MKSKIIFLLGLIKLVLLTLLCGLCTVFLLNPSSRLNVNVGCENENLSSSPSLKPLWEVPLEGGLMDGPIQVGNEIVLFDYKIQPGWFYWGKDEIQTRVIALDIETGQTIWKYPSDRPSRDIQKISTNAEFTSLSLFNSASIQFAIRQTTVT